MLSIVCFSLWQTFTLRWLCSCARLKVNYIPNIFFCAILENFLNNYSSYNEKFLRIHSYFPVHIFLTQRFCVHYVAYMSLCLYTGHPSPSALLRPDASTGKLLRVGSSYVRQLTEEMLISQENIKLLKCIGQGMLL